LPPPVALFAVTDYRARQAIDVCRQIGMSVPKQIAVLGVDNEDFMCRLVEPPLSSVARNNVLEGYQAAVVLDRLMRGASASAIELIPPSDVVERESTSVIGVADERIRKAIDFIQQHLGDPIDVVKVAGHIGTSRRWLEYAFRDAVRESPHQFIRERRLRLARHLLASQPRIRISEIAAHAGFSTAKQLTMTFHKWCGMSPRSYRRSLSAPK
jgi:LacI family transcriptional regulator